MMDFEKDEGMTLDETTKLSPCPWCKAAGRIFTKKQANKRSARDDPGRETYRITVGCPNPTCRVQPTITRYTGTDANIRGLIIKTLSAIWDAKEYDKN